MMGETMEAPGRSGVVSSGRTTLKERRDAYERRHRTRTPQGCTAMTTWVKVFNSMPAHPKLVLAGERAAWLFLCGLCYANEHLTDGFIARHALVIAAPGVRRPETLAARLVDAGLWHEVDGGWQTHDYTEHQRSSARIREARVRDAERKAVRRESNGSPRGQTKESARLEVEKSREEIRTSSEVTPQVRRLSERLAAHVIGNDAKASAKPGSDRWLTDMRLLVQDRGGNVQEVERIIDWCQSDPFWRSNILSPAKLRKQFTQLVLKSQGGKVVSLRENASDWLREMDAAAGEGEAS